MGLGDDHDAADAEGVELVKDDVDDGGVGPLRGFDQSGLHVLEVVDGVGIAIEQLDQQVPTQRVQSVPPPSSSLAPIYRTSPATLAASPFSAKKFLADDKN
jgi:hypothetical protein